MESEWRRHAMGLCALILLLIGIAFYVWPVGNSSSVQLAQGSFIKSGLVLAAAWLAYPHLNRLPGWLFGGLIVFLAAGRSSPPYRDGAVSLPRFLNSTARAHLVLEKA